MNLFFIFFTSFFIGIIIIPMLITISKKTGFLIDAPEGDALKIHTKKIPLLGGIAMIVSGIVAVILMIEYRDVKWVGIFLALLPVFLLGFYDDLKWKHVSSTKPLLKFAFLILCTLVPSFILAFCGISFNFLPFTIISIFAGFLYIFLCINAVNYQDGIDGLAGGLVLISLIGFMILSPLSGVAFALYVSLLSLGAVTAFLVFNFPPAKIFMGDSGAYSLGFILTVLAMLFSQPYNIYSVLGPLLIIGLPIFDGIYTNIRRIMAGKSIFLGDRSHFYDKLLQKGFSTKKTLAICYGLQIILVVAGIFIYK